jgi:hypothetical protein
MSSETDHPRQRTVAELLAAHGDGNVSGGRRRRRRETDEPDEEAYAAPAADPSDWRSAPPREPRRAAPEPAPPPIARETPPPIARDTGGRRRPGGDADWAAEQRAPERRAPERRAPEPRPVEPRGAEPRAADPWGADEPGADDWASERWDGGQWDDQDRWDTGRRDASGRDARPPQEQWGAAPAREPRYADPEAVEAPPRRARRAADEREAPPPWDSRDPAPAWETQGEPPRRPREREAPGWDPRGADPEPNGREPRARDLRSLGRPSWDAEPDVAPSRAAGPPVDEQVPTEQMPHVRRSRAAAADPAATSRIQQPRRRPEPEPDDSDDGGPSTMIGAPPVGAEAWHRDRTQGRRRPPDPADEFEPDEGPATMVGAPPAGAEAWHRDRTEGMRRGGDGGPPTQAAAPMSFDHEDDEDDDYYRVDYPAGLDRRGVGEEPTGIFAGRDADDEAPVRRRSVETEEKEQAAGGPAWAVVIAQWIAGAIGGAALWVGFRFLWRDLPVVALAAAVLVTVGLVVVVRALLRSSDLRTTLFAVLVGLLLTVSPAILVFLGR